MVPNRLLFEMDVLRPKWGWLLFLGILMATLGWLFSSPYRWRSRIAHRSIGRDSSRGGGARMVAAVRIFPYCHGSLSADRGGQTKVSPLGLGGLRWDRHTRSWDSAVGRLAVVWSVVPGSVSWNFTIAAWVVVRDVCR